MGKRAQRCYKKKFFSKINFICLSKPFKTSQYPEIKELQTKLFIPKYSFDQIYPLNFSRAIEQYSNYLKKFYMVLKSKILYYLMNVFLIE